MRKVASLIIGLVSGASVVIACSSADDKPGVTANGDGGPRYEGGSAQDSGGDGEGGTKVVPASCLDTTQNNQESDVDCGGAQCLGCALGKKCTDASDCVDPGATCTNGVCALCDDGKGNGAERDVDCGGIACGKCGVGKGCLKDSDCGSEKCNVTGAKGLCACPPDMTIIALADKGAFCIDNTEVTKGQYYNFITANIPVTSQAGACLTENATFVPRSGLAWPPATNPPTPSGNSLAFNMGLPVHYVDWCDAAAYCKWKRKQLCGALDGTSLAPVDANNAAKSAWYNACTAQGVQAYPYANQFIDGRCNGTGDGAPGPDPMSNRNNIGTEYGFPANGDTGIYEVATSDANGNISGTTHTICQGGSVGVFQMSGNVAEWEDDCDGTAGNSNCRLRGGSYLANNDPAKLSCAAVRTLARMPANDADLADVGIRCCQF